MACQSAGDERPGTRCYREQFPVHDISDDYEDPVSVVASTPSGLCVSQWYRNGEIVVYNLSGLVGEGNRVKDWRCETLSTSDTVLFGANFRGLYAWLCLESHWVSVGDTDVYCLALRVFSY